MAFVLGRIREFLHWVLLREREYTCQRCDSVFHSPGRPLIRLCMSCIRDEIRMQ